MDIRCIVTGQNESGKSVFIRTSPVKPATLALFPGYEFHRLWGSDSVPELPSDGTPPPHPRYFPEVHGFRFGFFTIPPDTTTRIDRLNTASATEEVQQKLPGMLEVLERDHPGSTPRTRWTSTWLSQGKWFWNWMMEPKFYSKQGIA